MEYCLCCVSTFWRFFSECPSDHKNICYTALNIHTSRRNLIIPDSSFLSLAHFLKNCRDFFTHAIYDGTLHVKHFAVRWHSTLWRINISRADTISSLQNGSSVIWPLCGVYAAWYISGKYCWRVQTRTRSVHRVSEELYFSHVTVECYSCFGRLTDHRFLWRNFTRRVIFS